MENDDKPDPVSDKLLLEIWLWIVILQLLNGRKHNNHLDLYTLEQTYCSQWIMKAEEVKYTHIFEYVMEESMFLKSDSLLFLMKR